MLKRQRVDVRGMAVGFGLAIIALMLLLSTGCATYNDKVAPYIPDVRLEGNVGGSGVGASIGFESKWTGEERDRSIVVGPDVDVDKLKESLEENGD